MLKKKLETDYLGIIFGVMGLYKRLSPSFFISAFEEEKLVIYIWCCFTQVFIISLTSVYYLID